ncbi:hypothetical protein D3C87_76200 [compost metagenome]
MKPNIKSSQRTQLPLEQEAVKQPLGIDYDNLLKSMNKIDDKKPIEKKSALEKKYVKDLRKFSNNGDGIAKEIEKDDLINKLDQLSIIPVPGLAVEYERDGSQERPPDSDWTVPHGSQWGPMTQ